MRVKYSIAEFLSKGEKAAEKAFMRYVTLHYWGTTQTKVTLMSRNNGTTFEHERKTSSTPSRLVKVIGLLINSTTSLQSTASLYFVVIC